MLKTHNLVALTLALILIITPAISSAKEKGAELKVHTKTSIKIDRDRDEDQGKTEDKKENKKAEKVCLRAFGHLIASGFKKTQGEVTIPNNCWLPFGIWKKLENYATTTPPVATPDTVAPMLHTLAISTGTTTANISWKSSEKASSTLFWSTLTPIEMNATTTASSTHSAYTASHSFSLTGLNASTTYYFFVRATDKSNNSTTSLTHSFTTK